MSRIYTKDDFPPYYSVLGFSGPWGLPAHYGNDISGQCTAAVKAFYEAAYGGSTINDEQLSLVIAYVQYHINAPVWDASESFSTELKALREKATQLKTVENVMAFLFLAMDIGLDPL